MKYTQSAFTLIEVLTSLTIIAILTAITLPVARNFISRTQDEILQKQLLRSIESAKFEAQARHAVVALCKSNNQTTCGGEWDNGQLIFLDENADGVIQRNKQIITVVQASHHGSIHWRSFPRYQNYLSFLPSGLMNSNNGSFWHCHAASAMWAIIINKAGRARVVYPDKSGVIKGPRGKPLMC